MKKLITLVIITTFLAPAFGQKIDYDNDSKWYFGFNVGGTWNTTDVRNKTNLGWGLMLGRAFNYNYGKKISYDLRLRYLGGNWYGQDYDITNVSGNDLYLADSLGGAVDGIYDTLGYTVNNFNTEAHELGLELAIHFNNLRDRTGWDPYIFGGVGVVWAQTMGDLLDRSDSISVSGYDYSPNGITKSEWKNMSDGVFDSPLDGTPNGYRISVVPSVGVGLAYQVGPKFSIGLEHRTMFYMQNNFDGYNGTSTKWGLSNDLYHYTSLGLKFHIGKKGGGGSTVIPDNTNNNTNNLTNTGCKEPEILLNRPANRYISVDEQQFNLQTIIKEVSGRSNIQFSINGSMSTNFDFNLSNGKFTAPILLQSGVNEIVIKATNTCGTTTETIRITFQECDLPTVNFTNPSANITTEGNTYMVQAQVTNATSVTYMVNGVSSSNYMLNGGVFSSTISLLTGPNTIQILVKNECGESSAQVQITQSSCDNPVVSFIRPSTSISATESTQLIEAIIQNVSLRNQVQLKVNGVVRSEGSFNPSNGKFSANLNLNEGLNTIVITATNDCGSISQSVSINISPCEGPQITMVQPSSQSINVEQSAFQFVALVSGVTNTSQIKLMLNGVAVIGGSYNAGTKKFQRQINLVSGNNTISLVVTNDCSSATLSYNINYNDCENPVVTILSPTANQTSNTEVLLKAKVTNVNNVNQISVSVNGANITGGTFNPITSVYQKMISLQDGVNTIQVIGSNDCGQNIATKQINLDRKITICHYPPGNEDNPQQIEIPLSAWPAHQAHGDKLGPCPDVPIEAPEKIVICHYPPGNVDNPQQIEIPLSAWPAHQAHGDNLGPCEDDEVLDDGGSNDKMVICHYPPGNEENPQQIEIPVSAWPAHQAHGDKIGPCTEEPNDDGGDDGGVDNRKITICHYPPGNVDNPQQIEIPLSAWPAHQAHGDKLGPCPVESNEGGVDEQKIKICHYPPGNKDNPQEIEIPLSAWPAHQAHGDKIGPCSSEGGSGSGVNEKPNNGVGITIGGSEGSNGGDDGNSGGKKQEEDEKKKGIDPGNIKPQTGTKDKEDGKEPEKGKGG